MASELGSTAGGGAAARDELVRGRAHPRKLASDDVLVAGPLAALGARELSQSRPAMPSQELKKRLWISFTVSLVSFLGLSCQWLVSRFLDRLSLIQFLVPFNVLLAGLFTSYWACVTTDPGGVPAKWEPPVGAREDLEVKRSTGGPRYCYKCSAPKPPRAHHCRVCKRCILRMDHHCPWIGGCVGYNNYASFVRFLTFTCWALCMHVGALAIRVWDLAQSTEWNYFHPPSTFEVVLLVANLVFGAITLLAVGLFTLSHYWRVVSNTSTIEAYEKEKVATLIRRGKIQAIKYPYDLGPIANIRSVMGRQWWLWCWPLQRGRRDVDDPGRGTYYRVGAGSDQYISICWPPKDRSHLPRAGFADDPAGRPAAGRRGSESSHTSDSSDDEDDVPLAILAQRVRRGSEGWEIGSPSAVDGIRKRIERDIIAWEARRERLVREFELEQAVDAGG